MPQEDPREPQDPELLLALEKLRGADKNQTAAILDRLRTRFLNADPQVALPALVRFLDSGLDISTGLEFVPGDGNLGSAPTLRVFLLDLLGVIEPTAADTYAQRAVFPSTSSPEEYAVALRNLWWSDPHGERLPELRGRLQSLLEKREWIGAPSAGFLEAFDAVQLTMPAAEALSLMSRFLEGSEALKQAAHLALERVASSDPRALINALLTSGPLGGVRAELMARADLRDPVQQETLGRYLLKLDAHSEEAQIFFKAFPNHNFSVAAGLFEGPRLPDAEQMSAMDLAARDAFQKWSQLPELQAHSTGLQRVLIKLNENAQNIKASASPASGGGF